jgi:hypothetical protein
MVSLNALHCMYIITSVLGIANGVNRQSLRYAFVHDV